MSNGLRHRLLNVNNNTPPPPSRILPRDAPFAQSTGTFNITRLNTVKSLYQTSWYFTLIHQSTYKILLFMSFIYILLCITFAVPYWFVSDSCGLGMKTFLDACYFSLETMVTIGYGTSSNDPYFQGCGTALPIIFTQSILSGFFDAVCLGLVFGRMSRTNQRASTIIFSDKAIIRLTNTGVPYFLFQVCEMRKHQLIEAHVRCYAFIRPLLNKKNDEESKENGQENKQNEEKSNNQSTIHPTGRRGFITKTMRLEHPDDELGGLILLAAPQIIAHRIDHWSPLCPPSMASSQSNGPHTFPSLIRRGVDQTLGREEPIFPLDERRHPKNNTVTNDTNTDTNTALLSKTELEKRKTDIMEWMKNNHIEILCLIEGIENINSGTLQCRHSYATEDCIFGNVEFDTCIYEDVNENGPTIDFDKFHNVINAVEKKRSGVPSGNDNESDLKKSWNTCSHLS